MELIPSRVTYPRFLLSRGVEEERRGQKEPPLQPNPAECNVSTGATLPHIPWMYRMSPAETD